MKSLLLHQHQHRQLVTGGNLWSGDPNQRASCISLPRLPAAHTTTDLAFCLGSKLSFVPVLEPGQGFRDKSLEAFVPGGRTGTKGA